MALVAPAAIDAQTADRLTISVAPIVPAEPAAQISFPIRVEPSGLIPRRSFIRVRGLPDTAALSDGHSIAPGSWAIPIAALPGLRITLPATAAGKSDVVITLIAVDGSELAEATTMLVVYASPAIGPTQSRSPAATADVNPSQGPATPVERTGPVPPIATAPAMTRQDRERALKILRRGDEELASGQVAPARLLYERAAELGVAQAAMALAATYDPAELTHPNLRGVQPDVAKARRWYERAQQLGAADAIQRLQRLGAE